MHLNSSIWLALLALAPGAGFAGTVNWPQPGMNAAHTGYNKQETTISKANIGTLTQKWAVPIPNGIQSAAVEVKGVAYVESAGGTIYAVNARTGATLWTTSVGTPAGSEGITTGGGLVFAPCAVDTNGHGSICALNARTGALVWTSTLIDSYASSLPVYDKGMVFFAYGGAALYGLNAATGAIVWGIAESPADRSDGLTFAVSKGVVYYQTGGFDVTICAVSETDGSAKACSPSLGTGYPAISVSGGKVLVVNDAGNGNTLFSALDATTLAAVWQVSVAGGTSNYSLYSPAVAKGVAYFLGGQNGFGSLYALSLKDGTQRWSYACGGAAGCVESGVTVANGVVFASCDRQSPVVGDQCAFNAKTGAVLRVYGSNDGNDGTLATPLVANGVEIGACGNSAGNLCAFAP